MFKMTLMFIYEYWIACIIFCFMVDSSNSIEYHRHDSCENSSLKAQLGSSVVLPCSFRNSSQSLVIGSSWVLWTQSQNSSVINLTTNGKIIFLDPRYGRVKAFPIQAMNGNYSIRIDNLEDSDLGSYRCEQGDACQQVKLEQGTPTNDMKPLVYMIVIIVTIILLLSACGYGCVKCIWRDSRATPDNINNTNLNTETTELPEDKERNERQQAPNRDETIYENNDHDPASFPHNQTRGQCCPAQLPQNLPTNQPDQPSIVPDPAGNQHASVGIQHDRSQNQHNPARMESQRRRLRFQRELLSRLRPASYSQHFYANQTEIHNQAKPSPLDKESSKRASFWKKKKKQRCEYENPIYNNSTDQLNKM